MNSVLILLLWPPSRRNQRWRHNFRQEYVTAEHSSKPINRHTGNIVIKILQFLSAMPGSAAYGHHFNPNNRRHAWVKTRTTAPSRRQR
ncbi:hypothetical protein PSEUDO8O_30621 [Pseudomonas sp. 8O]|nr:hypothetical protein PSEUDO8O_30621 [Pseudomonas sp. 8O]